MTRWLVVGAAGMLGHEVVDQLTGRGDDVVPADLPEVDITDPAAVDAYLGLIAPDVVVNCAAYTAVDEAESHEDLALRINGDGPANLARACATVEARLLHVSTDYVFPGDASAPYAEDAPTGPRSAYGRTKLAGEVAVRQALPGAGYVVRTAWLYGASGPNFIRTMIRLAGEKDTLDVVDDQRGQPTWAADVADRLIALGDSTAPAGFYHATSSGETTWFDLARKVFALLGTDPDRVHPTTSDRFVRPAQRPAYSVLGHDAWGRAGLSPIRSWDEALDAAWPSLSAAWGVGG